MSHSKFDFLSELNVDEQTQNLISTLLERAVTGSSEVFMTPLGKNTDPQKILSEWDSIFQSKSAEFCKPLIDLEESNRSKFGPRSIAVPWVERKELVSAYYGAGKDYVTSSIRPSVYRRLRPLTIANAVKHLKNNTNSGLPYYTRKSKIKEDVLANFKSLLERRDPCIMFTRTQESRKTRTVWGFPVADTTNEMRFYRPILEVQKRATWRAAIVSPDAVNKAVTTCMMNARKHNQQLVSIDFSSYDATVKSSLQKEAFEYFKQMFQENQSDEFDYIADRFRTIGLVTPDGVLIGDHGVPSGSTFTNEVDSVAQYLCANSIDPSLMDYQIQGDDGLYRTDDPDSLKAGFRDFGLDVNDDKSYVSDEYCIYLQNLHSYRYMKNGIISGIYPTYRALCRLIYQERFDNFSEYNLEGSDFYSIRAISILENCKHHPLFVDLVKFVAKKDKYGLKPSQRGIDNYIKMIKDSTGAEGIIAHQYSDAIQGIRSFETFKVLSEL